jgi:hypothetical protein
LSAALTAIQSPAYVDACTPQHDNRRSLSLSAEAYARMGSLCADPEHQSGAPLSPPPLALRASSPSRHPTSSAASPPPMRLPTLRAALFPSRPLAAQTRLH